LKGIMPKQNNKLASIAIAADAAFTLISPTVDDRLAAVLVLLDECSVLDSRSETRYVARETLGIRKDIESALAKVAAFKERCANQYSLNT
jgi:hypothetical protein